MIDYSKISDYEINWRVAEELGLSVDHNATVTLPQAYCGHDENGCRYEWGMRDYCNNPADAWQIILSEKIMLSPRCANDEWKAQIYLGRVDIFDNYASSWNKNPLRAAMIAFLMMKEIGNV